MFLLGLILSLTLAGCTSNPRVQMNGRSRMATVYYATDRQHVRHGKHSDYTGERSDPPGLHLGRETVALAPGHRLGCLDGAVTIVPDGALMATSEAMVPDGLRKSDVAAEQFATAGLRAAIRATTPPSTGKRRQVLVYVHGFNNGFDETIRKTAQLSTDLGLVDANGKARGVALAYSWPTMGGIFSYVADEENAEWTQQRLVPFLRAVSRICRSENADLCIIAHSMGARAVVRSLAELSQQPNQSGSLADHVILLAPDIGKGLFEQYVERFLPRIGHMTIYVSSRDRALALSTFLHGGRHRLGLFGSTVIAAVERLTGLPVDNHRYLAQAMAGKGQAGKMDMIDVSKGFAHQFGHTYSDARFIHDVQSLLAGNTTPGTGSRDNLIPREISSRLFRGTTAERLRYFQLK